ncbi:MAG: hypothetical protein C9356_12090 [Oleiphilus sp.]|nr:MAG: hypothetical protein C9356_12090 [Oleiphilus sp.]
MSGYRCVKKMDVMVDGNLINMTILQARSGQYFGVESRLNRVTEGAFCNLNAALSTDQISRETTEIDEVKRLVDEVVCSYSEMELMEFGTYQDFLAAEEIRSAQESVDWSFRYGMRAKYYPKVFEEVRTLLQ